MVLYIKNMACESCKILVTEALEKMECLPVKVELGIVLLKNKMTAKQRQEFAGLIKKAGLILVIAEEDVLVDKIKSSIAEYIDNSSRITTKLSAYLSKKHYHDYAYLSAHFSEKQNVTIEQFTIQLKIEKVKELLTLYNMSLTQIAYKLNYSSVAHLSGQFKKVTGVSATAFKTQKTVSRKTIQDL